MARKLLRFFMTEKRRVAAQAAALLREKLGKADDGEDEAGGIFLAWTALEDKLAADLERMFGISGKNAADSLGHIFDQLNERASTWATQRAAALVTQISDTTRDSIRRQIVNAFENGMSPAQLADALEAAYDFSLTRAMTIARTELAFAQTAGGLDAWRDSGVVEGKRWILGSEHGDPDECDDNADGGAVGLDELFSSGDDGPPAHPRCVCDIVAELTEE